MMVMIMMMMTIQKVKSNETNQQTIQQQVLFEEQFFSKCP